jgi:peptide deformylase
VRYYDVDGKLQEKSLRGWVARIFQHEYDHLQVCVCAVGGRGGR